MLQRKKLLSSRALKWKGDCYDVEVQQMCAYTTILKQTDNYTNETPIILYNNKILDVIYQDYWKLCLKIKKPNIVGAKCDDFQ